MSTTTGIIPDELIRRTEALLPAIAERALQTERDRRIPQETLDEIEAAGLNRVTDPRGHEDYFAGGDAWSCSAPNPSGAEVEPADGGWKPAGRWQYSDVVSGSSR